MYNLISLVAKKRVEIRLALLLGFLAIGQFLLSLQPFAMRRVDIDRVAFVVYCGSNFDIGMYAVIWNIDVERQRERNYSIRG